MNDLLASVKVRRGSCATSLIGCNSRHLSVFSIGYSDVCLSSLQVVRTDR